MEKIHFKMLATISSRLTTKATGIKSTIIPVNEIVKAK